jgi:hypothetical protein
METVLSANIDTDCEYIVGRIGAYAGDPHIRADFGDPNIRADAGDSRIRANAGDPHIRADFGDPNISADFDTGEKDSCPRMLSWRDDTNYMLGRGAPDIFRTRAGSLDMEIVRHDEYCGKFYLSVPGLGIKSMDIGARSVAEAQKKAEDAVSAIAESRIAELSGALGALGKH